MFVEQDIKDWMSDPVTVEFFKYVDQLITDSDTQIHKALWDNQPDEAVKFNAGLAQLEEVENIPGFMLDNCDDIKGE